MNLICPHCQKMLTVPDQNAGQLTKCSHCEQTFLVPSLPQGAAGGGVLEELPLDIPLAPLPPEPEKAAAEPPAGQQAPAAPEEESGVYRLAAEPPWPAPGQTVRREERISASVRPSGSASSVPGAPPRPPTPPPPPKPVAAPTPKAPLPPPPSGYEHAYAISLSPRVVQWIAPVSLVVLFFLLFLPWVGAYPGGHGVYTQNAWQAFAGTFSTDPVGEKVLQKDGSIQENRSSNWFRILLYLLLILAGIVLGFGPIVLSKTTLKLPPVLEQYWPWRQALLGGVTLLALLILLSLLATGLSLEKAIKAPIDQQLEGQRAAGLSAEELDISRGRQLGELNLQQTVWLRWTVFFNLLALAGIGLEFWLERRGSRLPPRAEFQW